MSSAAEKLMSLEEFLLWEQEQPERYEYAGGVVTMMVGGSLDHSTIASNIWAALRDRLRASGCHAFGGDAKVIANSGVRYPDVSVTCAPDINRGDTIVPDPIVVVEVLSPSTENEDRGRKKFDYFATASIRHYAIVEQDERRVDLYTRAGDRWTNEVVEGDAVLRLEAIGVELALAAIYEDTALDATRPREAAPEGSAGA